MKNFKRLILGIILFFTFVINSFSQWDTKNNNLPGNIDVISDIFIKPELENQISISTHSFPVQNRTAADWRRAIDSVWGAGLPTATKLQIFDKFWNKIDSSFACFHDITDNWSALKLQYRSEVANGVSRGRFAAIMCYLSLALREGHTKATDNILMNTNISQGTPLLLIGAWSDSRRFGAGLTPLPDSSLLVYSVVPNHPIELQRGDIVLGYDGIPWKVLVYQLLSYELPFIGWWGCSPTSFTHSLLMSAGRNWHLFDTIDVVKYGTNDTVHYPTSLLAGQTQSILTTEQMDISGVPKPDYFGGTYVSHGKIQGTNIGYIYCWGWSGNAGTLFYNAVQALKQTDALIIDFRMNFGGNMFLSDSAMKVLFNSTFPTIDWGKRTSPTNHLQLTALNVSANYKIKGVPPGYLNPIAVLTGPGALSSGDQVALRMKYHPRVRIFGKSTSTAFNSPVTLNLHADWTCAYANSDAYETHTPGRYLTHLEFPVDENVWLTRSGVAQGRDDVIESALNWINIFSGNSSTLLFDNAESGFGKWETNEGWSVIKSNAYSPVNSFTESSKGNYKNNANNSLTLKNSINVSNTSALVLSFYHKYATQLDKDFCRVEISSNNGATWQQAVSYSGTVSTIHQIKIDITKYANRSSNLKIRFRLTSDAGTAADGWYVDNITLTGYSVPGQSITGINPLDKITKYKLNQNYPNPFNPVTNINFDLPLDSKVTLKVYDLTGREVATLADEFMTAGYHVVTFNAINLSSGVYFYKLEAGDFSAVKKMMLIK
ncbi:MAG TPA: S41 family peptidase [Ignavibacteria bacterium]|nr:S41 family peptidase [Ignavibacteria bacterium]